VADVLVELAKILSPTQARSVAASLEIDGRLDYALATLPGSAHPASPLLRAAFDRLENTDDLASILRGFAAVNAKAPNPPRAVWSGPSFQGDSDHTTAAVARLIDEATEDVFASTYSATSGSPFVDALWRALARGVAVTVLVDVGENVSVAVRTLTRRLDGARFLQYVPEGSYGLQHSKVVVVDSNAAFLTSANLSEAAAHRNLEAGVLIRDPVFASGVRSRFKNLQSVGVLIPLALN
jgi:phosphatidylserine/phosphatidylglycerophosphate/cardiolipin synthase-like enzyme